MSDEDRNTQMRQTGEQPEGGDERAPEDTQLLRRGLMPPMPRVYPLYHPQGYEYQREGEEEDPYSYASLDRPGAPFRGNGGMDPPQYHIMGTMWRKTIEPKSPS
ncbi:hypothetical protein Fot_21344 [Forsythia ovata]|uniref:Uncharacterized protein n=1 Tax=Forsythia ovata TaxID=205694 RepID=A0ABD1UVN9_9LAMI